MAALIMVRDGRGWQASGALFDWTLEYLIRRLSGEKTTEWLRTIITDNLGQLWIPDLPVEDQEEIFGLLREGLLAAGERELPETTAKAYALLRLRELAELTR